MSVRKIDIPLFFCFAIFLYPIVLGNIALICYALVYGVAAAYIILNIRTLGLFRYIPNKQFLVSTAIVIMLLCSIIVPIILHTYDFSYVNEIVAIFRKFIIVLFLTVMILKRSGNKSKDVLEVYCFYFCLLQCAYVLVSIVFLLVPQLKDFWKSILQENAFTQNLYHNFGYAARFGWMGFSGYRSSIDCSFGIVFANYLYSHKDKKGQSLISTRTYYTFLIFCFLGNMFYARTGIIASGIIMILAILVYRNIKPRYIVAFILCISIFVISLLVIGDRVKSIHEWLHWAITPIIRIIKGEKETGNTSMVIITHRMMFMPELSTFIHGDGYFTDPVTHSYYRRTDLGFMRQLLFWGVPGMILTYGTTILSILWMKKSEFVFKLMLIICVVIFEFKGDMYYEVLPVFLILGLCENSKRIKNHSLDLYGKII